MRALDNSCDPANSVIARRGQFLPRRRFCPSTASSRSWRVAYSSYRRPKALG